jgi:hypothetical protein
MPPTRRAKFLTLARWTCLSLALAFAALSLASDWWWLKAWGTIGPWRASVGADRGSAYIYISHHWPTRIDTAAWAIRALPKPYEGFQWWPWFWPWRPLTTPGGWFSQLAFPSWLPIPIFALAAAALRPPRTPDPAACTACGYDRRGLRTTAPCPECGRNSQVAQ